MGNSSHETESQAADLNRVREQRQAVYAAAKLLDSLSNNKETSANDACEQQEWDALLSIPDWCFWPEDKRYALALTAGALFLAPAMRLWIDAKRVRQARDLLGDILFDAVIQYEGLPSGEGQPPRELPVDDLLLTSGRSVLLGSLNPEFRPRLAKLLPPGNSVAPMPMAKILSDEAQALLLKKTAEYIADQENQAVASEQ